MGLGEFVYANISLECLHIQITETCEVQAYFINCYTILGVNIHLLVANLCFCIDGNLKGFPAGILFERFQKSFTFSAT